MTWDDEICSKREASLPLIELGIRCTLSQLIETGVMHADPHGGNLFRLGARANSRIWISADRVRGAPEVRDGLVAAVTLLIFSGTTRASRCLATCSSSRATSWRTSISSNSLVASLKEAANSALVFPEDECDEAKIARKRVRGRGASAPSRERRPGREIRSAPRRAPGARAQIPLRAPAVLSQQRARARHAGGDGAERRPNFNILRVVYPFAVKRLLANPTGSPVLKRVLRQLVRDKRSRGWKGSVSFACRRLWTTPRRSRACRDGLSCEAR